MPDALLTAVTALLTRPGPWTTVLVDDSADRADPQGLRGSRRQGIFDRIRRFGDEPTAGAVHEALAEPTSAPSPSLRYLVAQDGRVEFSTVLQGEDEDVQVVEREPVPTVVPLLARHDEDFLHIVVQVSGGGADIEVAHTSQSRPSDTTTIEPDPDAITQPDHGGLPPRQTEKRPMEMRKRTQIEVAAEVDRLVRDLRPRLIVVAGEGRVRHDLLTALGEQARSMVVEYDAETRAAGADRSGLDALVAEKVAELRQADLRDALDLLHARLGREGGAATADRKAVVEALRESQVQALFLAPNAFGDERHLALDAAPWIALTEEDAGPIGILGPVPAVEAMARAALLTDAPVHIVPNSRIPDGAAALLRWVTPDSP